MKKRERMIEAIVSAIINSGYIERIDGRSGYNRIFYNSEKTARYIIKHNNLRKETKLCSGTWLCSWSMPMIRVDLAQLSKIQVSTSVIKRDYSYELFGVRSAQSMPYAVQD